MQTLVDYIIGSYLPCTKIAIGPCPEKIFFSISAPPKTVHRSYGCERQPYGVMRASGPKDRGPCHSSSAQPYHLSV